MQAQTACAAMHAAASRSAAFSMCVAACATPALHGTSAGSTHFVRKQASSMAASPPPITASGLSRNRGEPPSQMAHALMPFCQNSLEPAGSSSSVRASCTLYDQVKRLAVLVNAAWICKELCL